MHRDGSRVGRAVPSTGLQVELAYAAPYQFDRRDQLVSKRITMDLAALLGLPPLFL